MSKLEKVPFGKIIAVSYWAGAWFASFVVGKALGNVDVKPRWVKNLGLYFTGAAIGGSLLHLGQKYWNADEIIHDEDMDDITKMEKLANL